MHHGDQSDVGRDSLAPKSSKLLRESMELLGGSQQAGGRQSPIFPVTVAPFIASPRRLVPARLRRHSSPPLHPMHRTVRPSSSLSQPYNLATLSRPTWTLTFLKKPLLLRSKCMQLVASDPTTDKNIRLREFTFRSNFKLL